MKFTLSIALISFFCLSHADNPRCLKYKKLEDFPVIQDIDVDRARMELRAGTLKDVGKYFARIGGGCATDAYEKAMKSLAVEKPNREELLKFVKALRYPELSVTYSRWILIEQGLVKGVWKLTDMQKAEFDILKGKISIELNMLKFNSKGLSDLSKPATAEKFATVREQALSRGQILWKEIDAFVALLK